MTDTDDIKLDKYGIREDKPTQEKWDDMKVRDQIGITVGVERDQDGSETARRSNRALNDLGDFIHKETPEVSQLEYMGSAAVHIFMAKTLNQLVFISQTQPLLDAEERIVGPAITDLQKACMRHFGRKTTKIRSGF
jgi:hypothetical protein